MKDSQSGKNEESSSLQASIARAPSPLRRAGGGLLGGAVIIVVGLTAYRHFSVTNDAADRDAELKAGPHVRTALAKRSKPEHLLSLIGEAKPYAEVTLYGKISGYLRDVKVDKGDLVKHGQVLATIESPETNRAFEGAEADAHNKSGIADRMLELRKKELVSVQEVEQATSDAAVSKARVDALGVQRGYEVLRAPFDGMVTARYADPGALVQNAMNSQSSSLPVMMVSQVDRLRVYTYIDQRDAAFVKVGLPAVITLSERPGLELQASVTRVSGELDDRTRMLLTEIDVDNKNGAVVAGSFVQVGLRVPTAPLVQVPVEALSIRAEKSPSGEDIQHSYVSVLTPQNTIAWREVKVADTDGRVTRLISGVDEGATVALNLGSDIPDGAHVRPIATPADKQQTAPTPRKQADDGPKDGPKVVPPPTRESSENDSAVKKPRDPSGLANPDRVLKE